MVRPELAPGPLRDACGFSYQEFSNFDKLKLKGDPFRVGEEENEVNTWMEYIMPQTAKALAYYDHKYFEKYPAIILNNYGQGTLLYEGCMVSDVIQEKILQQAIERAGLKTPDQQLRWPIITKSGANDSGNIIRYYYNYSSEPAKVLYPYAGGTELISEKKVSARETLAIEPWGVMIIEE